ncbi:alpha-hydroxy-acid oxidizing enzyme [Corynebacterium sp. HMSC062E11]|uniref:alpha-hydroxy acid oxidase n=1 Tax=unclassified Corynebacterium TaxID=2624378 RepID=UPI0008A318BF|nr:MULTISPECIES: alpha-hydroxy acid oxidase [unclassified Corynebacterium]OFK29578.1 alpha-hydroxy-acid oxidizing enzyme [Corynebacterium sp. HMSC062E11]OFP69914.1 alpha-hydroxy-acid oxidizing enzyme [Corynebacterium sp. HMSC078C09]
MRLKRQLPNVSELKKLMRFEAPNLDRRAARLAEAADVWDLRKIAKRRTPKAAFDYVDGAARDEVSYRESRDFFRDVRLMPNVLNGAHDINLGTEIAGEPAALPFGIAPTGFTRFMHAEGEDAGSQAARDAGIPFTLSTMGTRSVEEVAASQGNSGRRWFQLYLWKDHSACQELIERAAANGYDTLVVTVDTPVAGQRLRDTRNGMRIPPRLTAGTIFDAAWRPEWWFNFLTTDPVTFASLTSTTGTLGELVNTMFDPGLNFEDLAWIRKQWTGTLFVKGIVNPEDARKVIDLGADGIVVSSHGGRQLDRVVNTLQALEAVRAEVGPDVEIIYDSGVMSGVDIAIALALGADFVLIGRAYLYGLMAGGKEGVDRVIELLAEEFKNTLQLLGVKRIEDLGRQHVVTPWEPGVLAFGAGKDAPVE